MIRKGIRAFALCLMALCVCCAALAEEIPDAAGEALFDDTVSGWHIVVENALVRDVLENITVELGYTDVQTSEYKWEASEGKAACLVKLTMEKAGSREKINWEDMTLTDENGTEYHRIEDSFITELGMKRMPGTALNFGVNTGWIAFEIDENATELTLVYPFEETPFSCGIEVTK